MANPESFKVIIAGGGIPGLVLTNALEKAGVDFLLLEKREIAQTGASYHHTMPHCEDIGAVGHLERNIRGNVFAHGSPSFR